MAKAKEQRKRIQRALTHLVDTAPNLKVALRELNVIGESACFLSKELQLLIQKEKANANSEETNGEAQEAEKGQGCPCKNSPD